MTQDGHRVLMACLEYWGSPFQLAGHHLARAFVRAGWKVAYVSVPISPLHAAAGWSQALEARFRSYRHGGATEADGAIWSYVPGAALTPHNSPGLRGRWLMDHWWRLTVPNVATVARRHGFGRVDLLYIDSAVQAFWLNALPHSVSVLRIADRLAGFSHVTPVHVEAERRLAARVDLVAHAGRSLEDDAVAMGAQRTVYLPNGVDYERLVGGDTSLPSDLAAIPRPRVIYVGAMEAWFDFGTMNRLAAAMPDVSFVLVGGTATARERLERHPNLHHLGRRPWTELSRYLHNADVGLIPFDVAGHPELVHGVHPLKLYEYLACGLPVVATAWEELRLLGSPAILCRNVEEFEAAIRRAIDDQGEAGIGQQFARTASWDARLRTLLGAVGLA